MLRSVSSPASDEYTSSNSFGNLAYEGETSWLTSMRKIDSAHMGVFFGGVGFVAFSKVVGGVGDFGRSRSSRFFLRLGILLTYFRRIEILWFATIA